MLSPVEKFEGELLQPHNKYGLKITQANRFLKI
jgi:hypothetical protein